MRKIKFRWLCTIVALAVFFQASGAGPALANEDAIKKALTVNYADIEPEGARTTVFVGDLYEKTGEQETKHIYLGGQRIASITGNEIRYYHADHLGGTNVVTNAHGEMVELSEYEPFGKFSRHEVFDGNKPPAHQYFTGQYNDDETGLYFYNSRYYNPELGRFITPDDIVPSAANPQTFNRYTYAYNNPVNVVDPDGHFGFFAAFIIGALIGGAASGIAHYQATGEFSFKAVLLGGLTGGLSGGTLGTPAAAFNITAFSNTSVFLLKTAAAAHLASQVANAAGWQNGASVLSDASKYLGYAFLGLHTGIGISDWLTAKGTYYNINPTEPLKSQPTTESELLAKYGENGTKPFINGVGMNLEESLTMAADHSASVLFYNPTHSMVADFTEAGLGWATGTSSLARQLGGLSTQLRVDLLGYSQGSIIASNALTHAAMKGGAIPGSRIEVLASGIGLGRLRLSAHLAGVTSIYSETKPFDAIRLISSELNPIGYIQGGIGLFTGIGIKQHTSY